MKKKPKNEVNSGQHNGKTRFCAVPWQKMLLFKKSTKTNSF